VFGKKMLGYVYVVTTNHYKNNSIYKIGFTTNLIKRLKTFNATRMDDDLFYCVRHWRTIHYSKLEAFLHNHLKEFRKKNEFFQVDVSLIEEGAELFARTKGPHFFHDDIVLVNAELYDVEYVSSSTGSGAAHDLFIFTDPSTRCIRHSNEIDMRALVVEWISHVDLYSLAKFMSVDVLDKLVSLLKQRKQSDDVDDLSAALRRLTL